MYGCDEDDDEPGWGVEMSVGKTDGFVTLPMVDVSAEFFSVVTAVEKSGVITVTVFSVALPLLSVNVFCDPVDNTMVEVVGRTVTSSLVSPPAFTVIVVVVICRKSVHSPLFKLNRPVPSSKEVKASKASEVAGMLSMYEPSGCWYRAMAITAAVRFQLTPVVSLLTAKACENR